MNCQSFVREEDIKIGRRLKIAQLHTWHIQKEGTRMHNPVYPISATSCQGNKIWGLWQLGTFEDTERQEEGSRYTKIKVTIWQLKKLSFITKIWASAIQRAFLPRSKSAYILWPDTKTPCSAAWPIQTPHLQFYVTLALPLLSLYDVTQLTRAEKRLQKPCNSMTCQHVTKQAGCALHHPTEIIISMRLQRNYPH
jgi:hypothetical protein